MLRRLPVPAFLLFITTVVVAAEPPRRAGLDWWCLQKLTRPTPPTVKDRAWGRNPIDAFVLAKLEAEGLSPAAEADRATFLRRVTFDLIGLPPTPEEIDAFVSDRAADAYEKVVDRLLASPHYGERWGRHWLDVVRFGESQGYERDKPRDHAWRYRDWVIRALNDDKPYPDFIREQIAGDQVEKVGPDGIVATGFLVCGPWDEVGATQQGQLMRKRVREEEMEDIVSAVGQTFLGLTVNCARCHNHKFDPIPQKDYFRLKAALDGVRPGDRPILPPATLKTREEQIAALTRRLQELEREVAAIEQIGRQKVLGDQKPAKATGPEPIARWSFDSDARDTIGSLHGTLHGGATVSGGRLRVDGKAAFLRTAPLERELKTKTLEAWVALPNLTQRGGGVLTVETDDGHVFDAIVFGEREVGKWIAGSDGYRRTHDLRGPVETAKSNELVHVATAYEADGRITVYRNGEVYGAGYVPTGDSATLRTYPAKKSRVLMGLRHTGGGNPYLAGEIEEARLYDRALSAAEVQASYRAGVERVPLADVLAALTAEQRQKRERLLAEITVRRVEHEVAKLLPVPLAYAANSVQPEPTFVLIRGDVEKPGEQVSAGGLSAVKTLPADFDLAADAPEGQRRLKLAEWIGHADNPLSWRVMANRVWHYHFGRGIVGTPSDFGFNGDRPTHPELLDWLACELRDGGRLKKLHRQIVLSATYRQSATYSEKAAAQDAEDRLLWRFAPRRLEGEAVRDAMLAVSGQLNPAVGGPSFRPFNIRVFNSTFYDLTDPIGPEYNRRTVYRMNINSAKSPLLDALDCPDPSVKAPRRSTTTTPLQALGLMNNSFVHRQAKHFAGRVQKEAGDDPSKQVTQAYRIAYGRPPTEKETARAAALAKEHGLESVCWAILNSSEFLYLR